MFFREKLINSLGAFGIILYYILCFALVFTPIAVLPVPAWARFIIIAVIMFVPALIDIAGPILWIVGFFIVLNGKQNGFAVFYYVLFAVYVIIEVVNLVSFLRMRRRT